MSKILKARTGKWSWDIRKELVIPFAVRNEDCYMAVIGNVELIPEGGESAMKAILVWVVLLAVPFSLGCNQKSTSGTKTQTTTTTPGGQTTTTIEKKTETTPNSAKTTTTETVETTGDNRPEPKP